MILNYDASLIVKDSETKLNQNPKQKPRLKYNKI